MTFEIKLPLFQGPFDLLLFFIERDELDIYDIPISRITGEFLDYLHQLEQLNMETAGEFIFVASSLMRIKAKMLLPRPETDQAGNEIDPRQELVQHLLEYKKYKAVASELQRMEADTLQRYERGNTAPELKAIAAAAGTDFDLQHLDLYRLLKVFQKAMQKFAEEQARPRHTVEQFPYTVEAQKIWLIGRLSLRQSLSFTEIIAESEGRIALVFSFLAILELIALQQITIEVEDGFNNFMLYGTGSE